MKNKTEFYNAIDGLLIQQYTNTIYLRSGETTYVTLEMAPEGKPEWHTYKVVSFNQIITISGELVFQYWIKWVDVQEKEYFL